MPLFIFCGKFLGEVLTENLRLLRPVEKSAVTSSELGSLSGSLHNRCCEQFCILLCVSRNTSALSLEPYDISSPFGLQPFLPRAGDAHFK